jgi:hypothetical protein
MLRRQTVSERCGQCTRISICLQVYHHKVGFEFPDNGTERSPRTSSVRKKLRNGSVNAARQ